MAAVYILVFCIIEALIDLFLYLETVGFKELSCARISASQMAPGGEAAGLQTGKASRAPVDTDQQLIELTFPVHHSHKSYCETF